MVDAPAGASPGAYGVLLRETVANGTGLVAPWRPFQFQTTMTATDLTNAVAVLGLDGNVTFGDATNGGSGTAHALTGDVLVNGNSNNLDEFAVLAGSVKMAGNPFPQSTPGRMWLLDLRGHGPIGVQPHLLAGSINYMNNYYNGSPIKGSVGIEIATYPGLATGAPWNAALTYPLDVGIIVTGSSGDPAGTKNSRQGFTTGIRIGGSGFAWDGIPSSRMGTGLSILDYETAAINIGTAFAGSTATGINIAPASGASYGIDTKAGTFTQAAIRLGNAQKIVARNSGDSGDIEILQLNSSSVVVIATAFRFTTTGLGFYGTGAQTKQVVSGAKGSNAALGSLITALSTLGLITDSSTA